MSRILIVDDEEVTLSYLTRFFANKGYSVTTAGDGESAIELVKKFSPDLVLLDLRLPGIDGLDVLKAIKQEDPFIGVVIMTAHGDVSTAVEALQAHADHFVLKPIDLATLEAIVRRVLHAYQRQEELNYLRDRLRETRGVRGQNQVVLSDDVAEQIRIMAESPTTAVLILGETGTGKGVVANLIHELSPRGEAQFVDLNCGGMSSNLMEMELFGYERGAFTDARQRKRGLLEVAQGGTIFLDEVGDLPLEVQPKLLKVLEERRYRRLGGTQVIETDVRILAATNSDLEEAVADGRFRRDLFYRLNVVPIVLLPLRERKTQIPLLAKQFIGELSQKLGKQIVGCTTEVLGVLANYDWPGNVRELRNVLERAVLICNTNQIEIQHLAEGLRPARVAPGLSPDSTKSSDPTELGTLAKTEARHIQRVLESVAQNRSRAAEILGINRSTLRAKIKKYGL